MGVQHAKALLPHDLDVEPPPFKGLRLHDPRQAPHAGKVGLTGLGVLIAQQDNAKGRVLSQAALHHQAVARLEDMQGYLHLRKQNEVQWEERYLGYSSSGRGLHGRIISLSFVWFTLMGPHGWMQAAPLQKGTQINHTRSVQAETLDCGPTNRRHPN